MSLFPLPIFPEGSLASSVITTVWIGVFVVAFFNLRLGWVLSGLVVPGYMVPLLLVKPISAGVVFAEGIATYGIVWFYSEFLCRHVGWSNIFGRDRFFALVLASTAVRIVSDGWLLPWVGEYINQTLGIPFDYRNNLHSFGLIIVSLIANNFWKTGLRHGVVPVVVTVGITYLIVRFGLMEFTNFSISNLSYLYEDMAVSILASPKAYIILITTAFVASRMNLMYGWDFAGILIPSLLALQWYQPQKILFSFIEAAVILLLAMFALRAPMFRNATIEGARKLVLFFNISFLYKFVLAYALVAWVPTVRVSDYFGFGYLLPTLIAIKMHDKGIAARMTRATLQTSFLAALMATLVGFALSFLPDPLGLLAQERPREKLLTLPAQSGELMTVLQQDKIPLFRTRRTDSMVQPLPSELARFAGALKALAAYRSSRQDDELQKAMALLEEVNFTVNLIENRYLYLHEKFPRRNWGTYVIDLKSASRLAIEAPSPIEERGSYETAAWIFRTQGAATLAIAGAARSANRDGSSDVLAYPQTFFHLFHEAFGWRSALQVRGWTAEAIRQASGLRRDVADIDLPEPPSTLFVTLTVPDGFNLKAFKDMAGHFEVDWHPLRLPNLQREATRHGFAELRLSRQEMRQLLGRALAAESALGQQQEDRSIEGYLQEWLLSDKDRIAGQGSNLFRKAGAEELLFVDDDIVTPILQSIRKHYRDGAWAAEGIEELHLANAAAASIGYQIVRYRQRASGQDYLILTEKDLPYEQRRYWGTYVFRVGPSQPFLIQAPRPIYEINSFEFAVALFESTRASALLIGGSHPNANQDHSSDILKLQYKENVFNLVSQAVLRESGTRPMMVLQSRTLGARNDAPMPTADLLIADQAGTLGDQQASPLGQQVLELLRRYGLSHEYSGGALAAAGYEAGGVPQSLYLNASQNKEFMLLWLSPLARSIYQQQTEATPQQAKMMALRIQSRDVDLPRLVADTAAAGRHAALPQAFIEQFRPFFASQDIVVLRALQTRWPQYRFERWVDVNSRQGFLAIVDAHQRLLGLVNLSARSADAMTRLALAQGPAQAQVEAYVEARAAWLLMPGEAQ